MKKVKHYIGGYKKLQEDLKRYCANCIHFIGTEEGLICDSDPDDIFSLSEIFGEDANFYEIGEECDKFSA